MLLYYTAFTLFIYRLRAYGHGLWLKKTLYLSISGMSVPSPSHFIVHNFGIFVIFSSFSPVRENMKKNQCIESQNILQKQSINEA